MLDGFSSSKEKIEAYLRGLIRLREETGISIRVCQGQVDFVIDGENFEEVAYPVDYLTPSNNFDEMGKPVELRISLSLKQEYEVTSSRKKEEDNG